MGQAVRWRVAGAAGAALTLAVLLAVGWPVVSRWLQAVPPEAWFCHSLLGLAVSGEADGPLANGERIYQEGKTASGRPVENSLNLAAGCAPCHGRDGRGRAFAGRLLDVTPAALALADGRPPYTAETLRAAIRHGTDPAGRPLDPLMPRWRLSERDLNDLLAYLRTLPSGDRPAGSAKNNS
ncbi:MAG: cytochrome c [candidate division NC10 bacterium]|nr:cytochrome c [candidate division NC10 bacterium]